MLTLIRHGVQCLPVTNPHLRQLATMMANTVLTTTVLMQPVLQNTVPDDGSENGDADKATSGSEIDEDTSPYAGITFAVFEKHLKERWNNTCLVIDARFQLDNLKQGGSRIHDFISRFDDLCVHIPNMDEDDKIHRFLSKLDHDFQEALAVDPSTRVRWTSYELLKESATNFASTVNTLSRGRRAGTITKSISISQQGLDQHHNRFKKARFEGNSSGPRDQQQQKSKQPSRCNVSARPGFRLLKNANGEQFSRHAALAGWLHGHSRCLCCFHDYGKDGSKAKHRENCTQPHAHNFPDGYERKNKPATS